MRSAPPRIYGIVFVLVTFSVLVQGATVPFVAGRLGIPMSSEGGSL
jgi:NhaP-type Na+/H+ or K+/H+ antiporter